MPAGRVSVLLLVAGLLCFMAAPVLGDDVLTVYSGRNESLIGAILAQFSEDTGIATEILYGGTSAVANQILTEGDNSPADVFIAQDGGALGALAAADMLHKLPDATIGRVADAALVSADGVWTGLSGRARVFVYNPESLEERGLELPNSILDLTGEEWRGLVGWAPTNASFVANVAAMRVLLGEEETAGWLADMIANGVQAYQEHANRASDH